MMRDSRCETCYYWSEMIAKGVNGVIHALCLNTEADKKDEFTAPDFMCPHYAAANGSAIDDPRRTA